MTKITATALYNTINTLKNNYGTYNVEIKINKYNNIVVTYFDGMFCTRETYSSYFAGNGLQATDKLALTSIESHLGFDWSFYGSKEDVVENIF